MNVVAYKPRMQQSLSKTFVSAPLLPLPPSSVPQPAAVPGPQAEATPGTPTSEAGPSGVSLEDVRIRLDFDEQDN